MRHSSLRKAFTDFRSMYKTKRKHLGDIKIKRGYRPEFNVSEITLIFRSYGIIFEPLEILILTGKLSLKNLKRDKIDRLKTKELDRAIEKSVAGSQLSYSEKIIAKAIDLQKSGSKVVEDLGRNQEVVNEILAKFGLSRFKLALIVINSSILLVLLFVLIFMSQNVFALPGLAAGLISSFSSDAN